MSQNNTVPTYLGSSTSAFNLLCALCCNGRWLSAQTLRRELAYLGKARAKERNANLEALTGGLLNLDCAVFDYLGRYSDLSALDKLLLLYT